MSVEVPDWLRAAVERVPRYREVAGPPHRGSVVVATGDGLSRICLITGVHDDHYTILLCCALREMVTETDVIVDGLPYPLVVQSELYGYVWKIQVTGHLAVVEVPRPDPEGELYPCYTNPDPLPLAGPSDPRWLFKQTECDELRTLSRDCLNELIGW